MGVLALGLVNNNDMCHFQAEMESELPGSTISLFSLHEVNLSQLGLCFRRGPTGRRTWSPSSAHLQRIKQASEINLPLSLASELLVLLVTVA